MALITKSSPMATQGSRSEVKLVIDKNTITTPPPNIMISHNNGFITNKHEPVSMMIIAKRTLMSLTSILTKFDAGYFRISLSLGGQALLWKTLIEPKNDTNIAMRHVLLVLHPAAFLVLWSLSLFILLLLSLLYMLRCLFFFNMVKVEFLHRVGVNYLFTPFISWLLLLQSSPFLAPNTVPYIVLWWVFAVPVVLLDVKIYGQWFTKGKRVLTMVAKPTSQLSVIGNLVGAQAAANMGWKESAIFMFSLGMAHYLVLFVTLYQRLSGGDHGLPVLLRPALFLFFAAPCVACLAWESIVGAFDIASKMLFFLSLFLFMSLVINFSTRNVCIIKFSGHYFTI